MAICYLGVGSNLGDRRRNIDLAALKINRLAGTGIIKRSRLIVTKPQGCPGRQRPFLNGCFKLKTALAPLALLKRLKSIEKGLGRAGGVRNSPRPIDLDILLYADRVIRSKELTVPHPRIFRRGFVLKPLAEVL
jgi:2-amino-4-hydroxy-6-hydroxymethyldihydropteridine diphosphokinase